MLFLVGAWLQAQLEVAHFSSQTDSADAYRPSHPTHGSRLLYLSQTRAALTAVRRRRCFSDELEITALSQTKS